MHLPNSPVTATYKNPIHNLWEQLDLNRILKFKIMICTLTVHFKNLDINKQEYRSKEYKIWIMKMELFHHAMH